MRDFVLEKMLDKLGMPQEIRRIFKSGKKYVIPNSREELMELAMGGKNDVYDVEFDVPGKGIVKEAWATKVKNGVVVNYTEPYMRRREPDCLFVSDDKPTDKPKFEDRFGYDFKILKNATLDWLAEQDLVIMPFMSGDSKYGYQSLYIGPLNAAFFAWCLADMQSFIPLDKIPENYDPKAVLYLAPTFRHTHFDGKQVVVHNRLDDIHEVFAYNLYPGPSAKKGIYGVLLSQAEKEGWTTLHASTVKVLVPHMKRVVTILHEGASGSGKTEMSEHVGGDVSGRITFGENVLTGQKYRLRFHSICKIRPVTDDMALVHPKMQKGNGKMVVRDAEDAWFIRTDNIEQCGTSPELERLCVHPPEPVLYLNIEATPKTTALVWEPIEEDNGKKCSNPRVVMPKKYFPRVVDSTVAVDIRSFGVRTPPCTKENPSYGIIGMFHILPPAIAWIWRLVAPRGFANPSIVETKGMSSEGVGSYWPFAAGKRVPQANILLEQIMNSYKVKYILTPNQHIGAWKVGFMPQWLAREFLVLHGDNPIFKNMLKPAKTPLLGYVLKNIDLPDTTVPREFVEVNLQEEVGEEAYMKGAKMLNDFFKKELEAYLTPELNPVGREIIEAFMNDAPIKKYEEIMEKYMEENK